MALLYPIPFLYGEDRFHDDNPYITDSLRRMAKRTCVTMREFYAYRLQQKNVEEKTLLTRGRLFQQYMVVGKHT